MFSYLTPKYLLDPADLQRAPNNTYLSSPEQHPTGHDPILVVVSVHHGGIEMRATTTADV